MTHGGCPAELLTDIYNAKMTMTIHYYQITRTGTGLTRIPLQQVGPAWAPGRLAGTTSGEEAPRRQQARNAVELYLPFMAHVSPPAPEPDDPAGCPCGWFDSLGRMLDYIPPQ
jgi:hypothetical protein